MNEPFEMHELEAYAGEFVDDFDLEAIMREVTEVDNKTGNRHWKDLAEGELDNAFRRNERIWRGEGWYSIDFSDGGKWTNDGPAWFEREFDLREEYMAAWEDATDTHLPYVEYFGDEM